MWRALLIAGVLVAGAAGCSKDHGWSQPSDDDPRLVAAREQARERWPEFVKAFRAGGRGGSFSAEVKYEADGKFDYLDLTVTKASDTEVTGIITNYPQNVGLLNGAEVTVPVENVTDWYYEFGEQTAGGFVSKVRAELQRGGG